MTKGLKMHFLYLEYYRVTIIPPAECSVSSQATGNVLLTHAYTYSTAKTH